MKPTELQIGDWVLNEEEYIQVTDIYENSGTYYLNDDATSVKDVSPIPLTPEILELNGFEQKHDGWLRCEDKANGFQNYIFIPYRHLGDIRECEINYVNIVKANYQYVINYVHDLQHALRLCGLNEFADNFKVE